ncbi:MAG TPA: malectin domain-containing carbohydrate-binding protein, partial [Polyangiaceae bacterium]|nr:malectin domain-containing carbohydrate-binding protein [Polyangiaceae bacterium]
GSGGSGGAGGGGAGGTGGSGGGTAVLIDSGGTAVAPYVADVSFTGGTTINHANTIDVSGVATPAPAAVYQTARLGNFSYTIAGFAAGTSHMVRLHMCETYFGTAGSRKFNVTINGVQVLANFDIFAASGAKNKAIAQQFTSSANATGQYVIQFTSVIDNSLVSGIEIR